MNKLHDKSKLTYIIIIAYSYAPDQNSRPRYTETQNSDWVQWGQKLTQEH